MINIIGGIKKRTRIDVPSNSVRPTSSHKREAIFSILESYGEKMNINIYQKTNVLDLFAGTGNISFEFASRGAQDITSIDNNYQSSLLVVG